MQTSALLPARLSGSDHRWLLREPVRQRALGVDGTYFGIELGVVKADYKFVTKFPYNVLPHPMILGDPAEIQQWSARRAGRAARPT